MDKNGLGDKAINFTLDYFVMLNSGNIYNIIQVT